MNLDKDKVKTGLECCRAKPCRKCDKCPYAEFTPAPAQCTMVLAKQAYALIEEQEAEIERLKATRYAMCPDGSVATIAYARVDAARAVLVAARDAVVDMLNKMTEEKE